MNAELMKVFIQTQGFLRHKIQVNGGPEDLDIDECQNAINIIDKLIAADDIEKAIVSVRGAFASE